MNDISSVRLDPGSHRYVAYAKILLTVIDDLSSWFSDQTDLISREDYQPE